MRNWTRSLAAGLAVALAGAAHAGEPTVGGAMASEVAPGTRVRIRLDRESARVRGERQLTGRLMEAGPERWVIASEQGRERIVVPSGAIERLDVSRGRGRRGHAAWKGLAIGAAVGAVAFGSLYATCDREQGFECLGSGVAFVYGTPLLGAVGAVTGAIVGEERWDAVEQPRRPRVTIAPTLGQGVGARLALSF
jgi:hypothetical protein